MDNPCHIISESKQLKITTPHNHQPDLKLLHRLKVRKAVLDAAASSSDQLNQVFNDATRGVEGAELVGYGTMYRLVIKIQFKKF